MTVKLPKIYEFLDYRIFLKTWYEAKKAENKNITYRYIGMKTDIDPGYLVRIFQKKKHLSSDKIHNVVTLLKLDEKEREYFELMILFDKAKVEERKRHLFEKLLSFTGVKSHQVTADRYEFYTHWYYTAIRELINCTTVENDPVKIAKTLLPRIKTSEARTALQLLSRLGFIELQKDGTYKQTEQFITTGEEWSSLAIRQFHRDVISLAHDAVGNIDPSERDLSCVTATLSENGLEKLKERIAEFRKDIFDICRTDDEVNRVYQVNIQLFPLSQKQDR